MIFQLVDLILHIDVHLQEMILNYGPLTYIILFLIVFCETGVVVMPFLPGDSLLFAAGAFAALGSLNLWILMLLFFTAAVLGDAVNYQIGHHAGKRVFQEHHRFLNRNKLILAEQFYEKHGGKAIIFARFMPIMRTLAPFVAGVSRMDYKRFAFFNITGGLIWVLLFTGAGYLFGNIPAVEENFTLVIFAIIIVSFLPPVYHAVKAWFRKN